MGLKQMEETIPSEALDDTIWSGFEEDAMADDVEAQAAFYE
jgi:hypothetical protein